MGESSRFRALTIKFIGEFSPAVGRADAPKPCITQRSTVTTCFIQLYYSDITENGKQVCLFCLCVYTCIYYAYVYTYTCTHIYTYTHIGHTCVGIYAIHTYMERERGMDRELAT